MTAGQMSAIGIGWDVRGWQGSAQAVAVVGWQAGSNRLHWLGVSPLFRLSSRVAPDLAALLRPALQNELTLMQVEACPQLALGIDAPLAFPRALRELLNGQPHEQALPVADMMAPNLLELETLCDTHLADLEQTRAAAHQLLARGVKLVLVKHLGRAAQDSSRFEMLLATSNGDYLIARPLYDFARQPVGVGDLISALMLANLLAGHDAVSAFERTNAAVDAVLQETWRQQAYELQLIAAQDAFALPEVQVRAIKLL